MSNRKTSTFIYEVAIGIHGNDIKEVIETYEHMSNKMFIHATPTLFNGKSKISNGFMFSTGYERR